MKQKLLLLAIIFVSIKTFAQDLSMYEKHWYVKGNDTLPYRLLLPKNFDPSKKYPLLLFLHGSGERGRDNEAQLIHGSKLFVQDSIRTNFPAIVVFPQCSADSYWSNVQSGYDSLSKTRTFVFLEGGEPTIAMKLLIQLLGELKHQYKLDDDRYYVGGLSMGGMGTFELVRRKPKLFAAAFPICGGANTANAKKLKRPYWWIFHGLKDNVVPPELSKQMATALQAENAMVKLTLYPEANHNSWDSAFAEKELLPWLFSNRK